MHCHHSSKVYIVQSNLGEALNSKLSKKQSKLITLKAGFFIFFLPWSLLYLQPLLPHQITTFFLLFKPKILSQLWLLRLSFKIHTQSISNSFRFCLQYVSTIWFFLKNHLYWCPLGLSRSVSCIIAWSLLFVSYCCDDITKQSLKCQLPTTSISFVCSVVWGSVGQLCFDWESYFVYFLFWG